MGKTGVQTVGIIGAARAFSQRLWLLVAVAFGCLVAGVLAPDPQIQLTATMAGLTFAAVVVLVRALVALDDWRERRMEQRLARLIGQDATPCFTTDDVGQIGFQNKAAEERFGMRDGATLVAALNDHFANPASVLYRLQSRAVNRGAAREDVLTRRGHTRLSVHRIGKARFLWRLEEFVDRAASGRGAEALSLPMLVANKSGVILFTNDAMRRLLGGRPKRLDRIFAVTNLRSGEEVEVASVDGPVRAILAEVEGDTFMDDPRDTGKWREIACEDHLPEGTREGYRFTTLVRDDG